MGIATEGASGDDEVVFVAVPSGGGFDGIPHEFKAKTSPSGEFLFHVVGDGFFFDGECGEIYVECAVGESFLDVSFFIGIFLEDFVTFFEFGKVPGVVCVSCFVFCCGYLSFGHYVSHS